MWLFNWKSKRVRDLEARVATLESEKFDLEHDLFQSRELERIASGKLEIWVKKHDDLLLASKS